MVAYMDVTTGKVATLIDENQVAITTGSNVGVRVGDSVLLYRRVEVKDPDSGESLGRVILQKVSLSVSFVAEKYALARVTDRVLGENLSMIRRPTLKKLTIDRFAEDDDGEMVRIEIGEEARVRRKEEEEPPF